MRNRPGPVPGPFRSFALPVLAMLAALPVAAQVQRSGGGAASTQLYADYQQAVSERTQLKADNAKLKSDLSDAQKQLATLRQQLAAARGGTSQNQAALANAQAAQATATKNLATLRGQADELIGRFRDTISQLRDVETDRTQLRQQLQQSKAAYDQCAVANDALYQVDSEVLDRYAHQGSFSHLRSAEPFTRITRTRIGNLVLEYHERAEQLRVQHASPAAGASAPASGAAVSSSAASTPNGSR